MAHVDKQYKKLVKAIFRNGFYYQDKSRDNCTMLEIPHHVLDIDMTKGFPLLTTKKVNYEAIKHELIWMLSGSEYIDYLKDNNVNIWTPDVENFSGKGSTYAGRIYGAQWRSWDKKIDQIQNLLDHLKADPENNINTRRNLVTAWQPSEIGQMALPPCHWAFQVIPTGHKSFGLKWFQRSCDTMLGIPFDIGLYATLGKLIEAETDLKFTRLIGDLTCVHIYGPHLSLLQKQMQRKPIDQQTTFSLNTAKPFEGLKAHQIKIDNYNHWGYIKAPLITKKV